MIQRVFIVLAISIIGSVGAQTNLIPNPGIEGDPLLPDTSPHGKIRASIREYRAGHPLATYDNLLSVFGVAPDLPIENFSQGKPGDELVYGWFQPTAGTPDFWNSDRCLAGTTPFPKSRKLGGKIGLVLKITPEYITTRLTEPLEKGVNYYLEFYIRAPQSTMYQQLTTFGGLFTQDMPLADHAGYIKAKPQVVFCDTTHLNNPYQWQKISGCFTASGDEEYLTLGCFDYINSPNSSKTFDPFIRISTPGSGSLLTQSGNWWYYLLDDVFLAEDDQCEMFTAPAGNVTVLIDVSASMFRGKYMDAVKSDLLNYLLGAGKNSRISILSFAAQTQVIAREHRFTSETEIEGTLDSLVQGSKTDIKMAIRQAYHIASTVQDTTLENRIILVTDAGFELDESVLEVFTKAREKGISFTMFHYGDKDNEVLEKALKRNGVEYHASTGESLEKVLIQKVDCGCNNK